MQILCLNAWGGTLHRELIAYLGDNAPDVLCLQEVVHTPNSSKDWLTYRDGSQILPQRANLFREVRRVLPNHVGLFCPTAQGHLWDGEEEVPSQSGLATFVHQSHPIIGQVQGFVHGDYSPVGYGPHPRSRNAHGVRVYDYARQNTVSILHMHGLRDLKGKVDTPERAEQARRLLSLCDTLSHPTDLRVICGDFNIEPESETLQLFASAGFSELVTDYGIETTRTSHYPKKGRYADYMLVDDKAAVVDFEVVNQPEVSDHCPLVLTI